MTLCHSAIPLKSYGSTWPWGDRALGHNLIVLRQRVKEKDRSEWSLESSEGPSKSTQPILANLSRSEGTPVRTCISSSWLIRLWGQQKSQGWRLFYLFILKFNLIFFLSPFIPPHRLPLSTLPHLQSLYCCCCLIQMTLKSNLPSSVFVDLIIWSQLSDLTFCYAQYHHTDFDALFLLMKYLKILILTFHVREQCNLWSSILCPHYRKDQNFRAESLDIINLMLSF